MERGLEDDTRGNRKCEIDGERYIVFGNIITTKYIYHMGSRNGRNIPQFYYLERFKGRCDGSQMEFQCYVKGELNVCVGVYVIVMEFNSESVFR